MRARLQERAQQVPLRIRQVGRVDVAVHVPAYLILLPARFPQQSLIRSALRTFEARFYAATLSRLSAESRREMNALIVDKADAVDVVAGDNVEDAEASGATIDEDDDLEDTEGGKDDEPGSTGESGEQREMEADAGTFAAWDAVLRELDTSDALESTDASDHITPPVSPIGSSTAPASSASSASSGPANAFSTPAPPRQPNQPKQFLPSPAPEDEELTLQDLRVDPGPTGGDSVLREIAKLRR